MPDCLEWLWKERHIAVELPYIDIMAVWNPERIAPEINDFLALK
jgi:hypothetical protein